MNIIKKLSSLSLMWLSVVPITQAVTQKPNVIFILTDDQGYGDMACHGNPWIKTPNLDNLYAESIRFTNFHSGTTSAPTRSGIMTGKYCNKVGVWHTINGREILSPDATTLAEQMKKAGYRTGIFGKWHLGDNYPFRPQDRGFDEVLIHGGGGVGQQPDYWNNDYFDDTYFHNGKPEKFSGYCTDIWFSEAMKFIEANKHKPFFCYLSTNAPHSPYHVEKKYSDLYKNNPNIPFPNFYGMITNLDEKVGELREKIRRLGIADHTIFIFMTDNGTSGGVKYDKNGELISGYNANMRGIKGSPYDGGHRVPFFIHWPDGGISSARDIPVLASYIDIMPTILDLCSIPISGMNFDGESLKPLITGESCKWPDRVLFTDTQREEFLVKWKQFAVMTDRWRLVGKEELYDISIDPGQKRNVADQHPEIARKLKDAYEVWWEDVSRNGDDYQSVIVGSSHDNHVRLNSHDFHTDKGIPAWSQEMVRLGKGVNGFWVIDVAEKGMYEIELCRWPKESKLKINDKAPAGEEVPGGKPYSEGIALNIIEARIKINEQNQIKKIQPDALSVRFTVKLDAGKTRLQTCFTDNEGVERGAYYAYLRKM